MAHSEETQRWQCLLQPGEELEWVGGPGTHRILVPQDAIMIPLSLFIACIALLDLLLGGGNRPGGSGPIVIAAGYLVIVRFAYRGYRRRHTAFALTNLRALVAYKGKLSIEHVVDSIASTTSSCQKYVTVTFGTPMSEQMSGFSIWRGQVWLAEDTGLDSFGLLMRRVSNTKYPLRFYGLKPGDADDCIRIARSVARVQQAGSSEGGRQS